MNYKFISWNVAGFRACLKKGFAQFFAEINADVICLQEVKAKEDQIDFKPAGYKMYLYPAKKNGYAGTLIYSRLEPLSIKYGIDIPLYDDEGRLITLEFINYYLVNVYAPNIKRDLSRMNSRMNWEDALLKYIKKLEENKPVIICGDFNVAHEEIDIKNVKSNIGNAGFTYEEREKFSMLLESGFTDTFRFLNPYKEGCYTWWSYRQNVRERNIGWRLDYFIISNSLKKGLLDALIYQDIYGSDHCPIGIVIKENI